MGVSRSYSTDRCLWSAKNSYYIVYGSGQSGKTSLLLHLRQRLWQLAAEEEEDAKVLPCWADFQNVPGAFLSGCLSVLGRPTSRQHP